MESAPADRRLFPPEVAMHIVKIACERPELRTRALSTWDCQEIARELVRTNVVVCISAETIRTILAHHKLKPWRMHMWLSAAVPRDASFVAQTGEICELSIRTLRPHEAVMCVDEKTSIQPRPRKAKTKPAVPGKPVRLEHEYARDGALNLLAVFNTRIGKVIGRCYERKRQIAFVDFLEALNREVPKKVTTIHIVLDNVRMHKGKQVNVWLEAIPIRVLLHTRTLLLEESSRAMVQRRTAQTFAVGRL